jgi:ankyrin repeat protein
MIAAQEGYVEIVQSLLENGANPDQADTDGITPLMLARKHNYKKIANLLIEHKKGITKSKTTVMTSETSSGYLLENSMFPLRNNLCKKSPAEKKNPSIETNLKQ